jgi:hypothetical protein
MQHPDQAPRGGFDLAVRLAAATVAMTAAAIVGCADPRRGVIATTNPVSVAIAAILALLAAGSVGTLLAWLLRR